MSCFFAVVGEVVVVCMLVIFCPLNPFQNLVIFVHLRSLTYSVFHTTGPNDPRFFPSNPFPGPFGGPGPGYVQFSFTLVPSQYQFSDVLSYKWKRVFLYVVVFRPVVVTIQLARQTFQGLNHLALWGNLTIPIIFASIPVRLRMAGYCIRYRFQKVWTSVSGILMVLIATRIHWNIANILCNSMRPRIVVEALRWHWHPLVDSVDRCLGLWSARQQLMPT